MFPKHYGYSERFRNIFSEQFLTSLSILKQRNTHNEWDCNESCLEKPYCNGSQLEVLLGTKDLLKILIYISKQN